MYNTKIIVQILLLLRRRHGRAHYNRLNRLNDLHHTLEVRYSAFELGPHVLITASSLKSLEYEHVCVIKV